MKREGNKLQKPKQVRKSAIIAGILLALTVYFSNALYANSPPSVQEMEERETEDIIHYDPSPPSYPGGDNVRMDFIRENLVYPEEALEKGIEGRVFVTFIVEKDGSLSDIEVTRGIGYGLDEEAVRIVKMMPKWNPGKYSKPYVVRFTLPILFSLEKNEDK